MSDNLKKYSFKDLLAQGKLRIPKIQRDYAQGRLSKKVNEIRKVFVHTLLLVIKGKRPETELDFVYGSNQNGAFEPLDGQQRLTTLFLLHWMMGVELCVPEDKKHSAFTYETRNTSEEFCDELVQHDAMQFVKEALKNAQTNKTVKDKKDKKPEFPSLIIKGRDWFKWEWKYDPTILSMLVMIDSIYTEMGEDWKMNLSICRQNLEHITFNLLNLGEFGLSNELFIKMNARGKQLSDFDKLKSTLEEELQIQQKEKDEQGTPLASAKEEELWRTLMDGAWIDFFWHKYARKTILETEEAAPQDRKKKRLEAAKLSELQFKKLLLRMIGIQFFEREILPEQLKEAAYNLDESKIDNLLFAYTDSLSDLRSEDQHIITISSDVTLNFKQIVDDINLLIYKDNDNVYNEISSLLPEISHIEKDQRTLFDMFLEARVPNDVELTFYSMMLFLRAYPEGKTKKGDNEPIAWYFAPKEHAAWLRNLEDWVRSSRNVLLNDNNNQRIDTIQKSKEATNDLNKLIADFKSFVSGHELCIEEDDTVVKQFFAALCIEQNYPHLDNQSLAEEKQKASLILEQSKEWEGYFNAAEQHEYLWGQIRCLLNWSAGNLEAFKEYSKRLQQLLDCIDKEGLTYYAAMLAFAPDCWQESNRLYLYNRDRDNSFKRYLREHTKDGQSYGTNIKAMIDLWIKAYCSKSAKDFLESLISSKRDSAVSWIQCILTYPSILEKASHMRIFSQKGHVILAQLKTDSSHCYDPIFVFFEKLCQEKDVSKYKLYDSKDEYEHAFEFENKEHKYLVRWDESENGLYSVETDEADAKAYTPQEVIELVRNIIS